MLKKKTLTRKKKAKRVRKYRKTQRGGLNFLEFMELTETFELPLYNEIAVSFKNLKDSENMIVKLLQNSPDNELIRDSKFTKNQLYDYAINTATMKSLNKIEQKIKDECKDLADTEYLIEILKNAWDSNLEYSYNSNSDDESRLNEFKKRYIKVILQDCNKIIIINNGILFPDEKTHTKTTHQKDIVKIKNYKLLGGQNMGLNNLKRELKEKGYDLITENHGHESWVIIERKKDLSISR